MRIVPLPPGSLLPGLPLPFALRDGKGQQLVSRGRVVPDDAILDTLLARSLWVDANEAEAYECQCRQRFEASKAPDATMPAEATASGRPPEWPALLSRTAALLHGGVQRDFCDRVAALRRDLMGHIEQDADRTLMVLVRSAADDLPHYSAWHALLVAAVCELSARHLPTLQPAAVRASLGHAALTMNLSMSGLQDRLTSQDEPPSPAQRRRIREHAAASMRMLLELGVTDRLWLEAVLHHHDAAPGPLDDRPLGQQMGRMVQRADIFGARLSPRRHRRAMSPVAAAQAAYLDERRQPDPAGTALVKATGIYPPGALVELACAEVAVVLKRGARTNQPLAAAIGDCAGHPLPDPARRDTSEPGAAVVRSLAPHEVRQPVRLETLLGLYATA